jgi:hypothetical protein
MTKPCFARVQTVTGRHLWASRRVWLGIVVPARFGANRGRGCEGTSAKSRVGGTCVLLNLARFNYHRGWGEKMKRTSLQALRGITVLVVMVVSLAAYPATLVADHDDDRMSHIAPIHTEPEGQTYGRWAAEWWQWALGIPQAVNPVVDTTGQHCAQRQVDRVWFLAGSFSPSPIVRKCEVPVEKSLFFPLINTLYGAFLNDPPETRTERFVREAGSCTEPATISVWIDGFKVPKPTRFFTGAGGSQSPIFNVQLSPGNVFGVDETAVPELVLSPSAEQGYYLFVRPLPRGSHTIRWIASGCMPGNIQDITYHLTVVGGASNH